MCDKQDEIETLKKDLLYAARRLFSVEMENEDLHKALSNEIQEHNTTRNQRDSARREMTQYDKLLKGTKVDSKKSLSSVPRSEVCLSSWHVTSASLRPDECPACKAYLTEAGGSFD